MADLSLTYTLTNGTATDADKVMQNYNDIKSYVNASVIRTDGNTSMAAALTLVGTDPTNAAHAVQKNYLDGAFVYATGVTSVTYTADTNVVQKFATETYDYVNGAANTSGTAYDLATGIFTAPKTGVYLVSFSIKPSDDDSFEWYMRIIADGVTYNGPRWNSSLVNTAGSSTSDQVFTAAVHCTAAATIAPYVRCHGGSPARSIGNFLTIAWLHA